MTTVTMLSMRLLHAGAGLLQTWRFIVEEDLAPVLADPPGPRHMPRRVRVFIDFPLERLSSPPGPRARY
jgi:hypothetical protein